MSVVLRSMWRFLCLPLQRKIRVVLAVVCLGIWKLAITLLPYRLWSRLFRLDRQPRCSAGPVDIAMARATSDLVCRLARRLPWPTKCLDRALACKSLLALSGVRSHVCLGVRFGPGKERLVAHAWLTIGTETVMGESEAKEFFTLVVLS